MPESSHRESEVGRLCSLLADPPKGISVFAVSGPGGVGKTYLLNLALEAANVAELGYLQLSVDGANSQSRGDFFAVLEALFRSSLPPPAVPGNDYFPRLRELAALHRAFVDEATAEMSRKGAPEAVKAVASLLLKGAHVLNSASQKPQAWLATVAGDKSDALLRSTLDEAWELAQKLDTLKSTRGLALWGPVRDLLGITRRNRMKKELYRLVAEELRTDLRAAIGGYEGKDRSKLTHAAIPGRKRLLLVLDDYEMLSPIISDFLVGALLPELEASGLTVVIGILCRDELESTHPGWAQHCKRYIRQQISLQPFSRDAAFDLMTRAGIAESRREELFEATQGYPFLLSLVVEESTSANAGSAIFLKRFFDRTTRWMSATEQEWFVKVCYLDRVNEDTLRALFPPEDVTRVQDWFEREPSVRDPLAADFRVRPLIKDKVLRYEEIRAPSRHRERLAAAR